MLCFALCLFVSIRRAHFLDWTQKMDVKCKYLTTICVTATYYAMCQSMAWIYFKMFRKEVVSLFWFGCSEKVGWKVIDTLFRVDLLLLFFFSFAYLATSACCRSFTEFSLINFGYRSFTFSFYAISFSLLWFVALCVFLFVFKWWMVRISLFVCVYLASRSALYSSRSSSSSSCFSLISLYCSTFETGHYTFNH